MTATTCCNDDINSLGVSDAQHSQITWTALEKEATTSTAVVTCYTAELTAGTHRPLCLSGGLRTGLFLSVPISKKGGSCTSPSSCPDNAVACGRNAHGGVVCYGCSLNPDTSEYTCKNSIDAIFHKVPDPYVYPGKESIELKSSDAFCTQFSATLDGELLGIINSTFVIPLQMYGPHEIAVTVNCIDAEGEVQYTSDTIIASWIVLDESTTNTSISGVALTSSNQPMFSLMSNKLGAAFNYKFSNELEESFVPGATSLTTVLTLLGPDKWNQDEMLYCFEASTGSASKFVPQGLPILASNLVADAVTKQSWARLNTTTDHPQTAVELAVRTGSTIENATIQLTNANAQLNTNIRTDVQTKTTSTLAAFQFTGSTFKYQITLDGRTTAQTENFLFLSNLRVGQHVLMVAAMGLNNAIDSTPSQFKWHVLKPLLCQQLEIDIAPLVESRQRWSLLRIKPLGCTWTYSIDYGEEHTVVSTLSNTESSTVVLGPISIGPHSIEIQNVQKTGSPVVATWTVVANTFHETIVKPVTPFEHGAHSLNAYATDPMYNTDQVGKTHTFFVDLRPPNVSWSTPFLPSVAIQKKLRASVVCHDNGDYFDAECANVQYTTNQGKNWSNLVQNYGPGDKLMHVDLPIDLKDGDVVSVAINGEDLAGNRVLDWSSSTVDVLFDLAPPTVQLVGAVNMTRFTGGAPLALQLIADDFASSVARVTCQLDDTFLLDDTNDIDGQVEWNLTPPLNMLEGPHTIQVNATDTTGQFTVVKHHFFIDTTPPVVTIAASDPHGFALKVTKKNEGTFNVNAVDSMAGVAATTCMLDGVELTGGCDASCAVDDGPHVFSVVSTDTVGNTNAPQPIEHRWTTDTAGPDLTATPLLPVVDALSLVVDATCTDAWSECFVEWEVKEEDEDGSGQKENDGCEIKYNWRRFETKGGGKISTSVAKFGTYQVHLRPVDALGNVGNILSRSLVFSSTTRDAPKAPTRTRSAVSSKELILSWEDSSNDPSTAYIVEYSTDAGYPENEDARTVTVQSASRKVSIPLKARLEDVVVVARVKRVGSTDWSLPSSTWIDTSKCMEAEYLNTIDQPLDPDQWICSSCPEGSSCLGDVTWDQVKGLFGYWRVPGPAPQFFEPCIFAAACLGAPNPALAQQFSLNDTDLALTDSLEVCNEEWGHRQQCTSEMANGTVVNERCRLCNSCMHLYQSGTVRGRCDACPKDRGTNIGLLLLGFCLAILGSGCLVWLAISAGGGVVEVSEAIKKIIINYLQVVSLASVFPVRWPAEVEEFFAFQSAISSVSQTLLSPDCELSYMTPAEAFYQKQLGFAGLPVAIVVCCTVFWLCLAGVHHCHPKHDLKPHIHYSDRAVLSWVVLLYL